MGLAILGGLGGGWWARGRGGGAQGEGRPTGDSEARHAAETALRDAEERYLGLFLNSPDSIFWIGVSEQGTFVVESVNPAQEKTVGLSSKGLLGKPLTEWLPPEAAAKVVANYRRCVAAGMPISYEEEADLGAGPQYFQTLLVPVRNVEGRIHRLAGISRDITDQHRSREASREQELLFRRLFEHSVDANLLIVGTQFTDCNAAAVAILGAPNKEAVLNTHPSELSPPFQPDGRPSKEKADEMIAQAFQQGYHRFEWTHRKLDGTLFPVEVMLSAIPYQGRQILHTTWRDRTEARRAEENRRQLEAQVQQAQKMESLGVLAGGIAHDFNNLLTAILGNLNLAQLQLGTPELARPFLLNAEATVLRAADLTKQMLAYSGRGRFVISLHDLNAVVGEMTRLLTVSVTKKATLKLNLAEGLPPIEVDGTQLQQVVMNLVTNASDALGDQEGVIEIRTGLTTLDEETLHRDFPGQDLRPGSYVTLVVRDEGQGMDPEILARIFDPFFTTKATGRGLGLSAMLGILKGHQAGLTVQSEVGRGSTFKAYFPSAGGMAASPKASAAILPITLKGRVLLVDDEPTVRSTLHDALGALGLEVVMAGDGLEALERLQAEPASFDLVLMDLTMPRMDGHEAFRAMRHLRPDLPVILMSGYSEQESIRPLQGLGLAGFLQKPYTLEDLRKTLTATLRG